MKTDDAAGEVTVSGGGTEDDDIAITTRRSRYRITISDVALDNASDADPESRLSRLHIRRFTIQDDATPAG